jgi:urease accessory protein
VTLAAYMHSFVAGLISAAQRCMPLGQTQAQRIVADQTPLCLSLAQLALTQSIDDLGGSAFLADIAAMQHETLQPRIFRS